MYVVHVKKKKKKHPATESNTKETAQSQGESEPAAHSKSQTL